MFDKYKEQISKLNNFEKEDILNKNFQLYNNDNISIYYAPHNEIVNEQAKVFIVGITPGWTQTKIAYQTANILLQERLTSKEIKKECKKNSRFAGTMRKNIIDMLDELKLNEKLKISSCKELFDAKDNLLHTTSMLPYPVFINKKNYTGHTPKVLDNEILTSYIKNYFYEEVKLLPNALIIPLGISVEEVLHEMIKEGIIKKDQCLFGFPHPSGANGHRKHQFENNKEQLKIAINKYFEKK